MREQARRFSVPAARSLYGRLLAFDREIKTGRLGPVLALDRLAAEWNVSAALPATSLQ